MSAVGDWMLIGPKLEVIVAKLVLMVIGKIVGVRGDAAAGVLKIIRPDCISGGGDRAMVDHARYGAMSEFVK